MRFGLQKFKEPKVTCWDLSDEVGKCQKCYKISLCRIRWRGKKKSSPGVVTETKPTAESSATQPVSTPASEKPKLVTKSNAGGTVKIDPSLAKPIKKKTPTLSLTDDGTPEEVEKEEEKVEEINETLEFNQEELNNALSEYIEIRKQQEASDMELLILNKSFELLENFQIKLVLSNSLELNILERAEQELVQFLRKQLQNGKIKLLPEIKEQEAKDKLYTDRDKFQFMVEKNPELQKLKDRLGLDFEF